MSIRGRFFGRSRRQDVPAVAFRLLAPVLAAAFGATGFSCSATITNAETPSVTTSHPVRPVHRRLARPASPGVAAEEPPEETDEQVWEAVAAALGREGKLEAGVYAVAFPRDDLEVSIQGNDVPAAAGIASEFRFYRCPCGRINVIGQFVVADYEANDVIDALRENPQVGIEIASVGPFLLHEKPRLTLVRFFGENARGGALARALRTALEWTGDERMAPRKE